MEFELLGLSFKIKETQNRRFQLGSNINNPTIKFTTSEGREIVGDPIVGFISQFEVVVPSQINIIYNSKNPKQFCLDVSEYRRKEDRD